MIDLEVAPPGLWRDEAYNGVFARGILEGSFAMYFMDKEPLFLYIQALSVALFGNTIFALRIVSALVGIATVTAEYFLVKSLFGRGAAIVAALGLAVSYWHVAMSRNSFRAIMVPLFATLVLYFFWRGVASLQGSGKKGLWYLGIAGALVGLSMYTYISARFIPVVLVFFLGWLLITRQPGRKGQVIGFAVLAAVSLLVFAPLGAYYVMDPEAFFGRPGQVLAGGFGDGVLNSLLALLSGFARALGAFFVQGDLEWRHNIAGRPAMDILTGVFLLTGLLVAVFKLGKPAFALVLLASAVMLIPSAITIDNPHYLRAMGALPAVYALVGIGAVWIWEKLRSSGLPGAKPVRIAALSVIGVAWLWLGPYTTWNDYFNVWAKAPKTLEHFEAGVTEAARYLNTLPQDTNVLVSTVYYPHSDIRYLTRPMPNLRWFDGNEGLLIGQSPMVERGQGATLNPVSAPADTYYLLTGPSKRPLRLLENTYPGGKLIMEKVSESGYPLLAVYSVPAGSMANPVIPAEPIPLTLGQELDLVGFDLINTGLDESRATISSGERLEIAVYWRVKGKAAKNDYAFFAHLVDNNGKPWGQSDVVGYPSSQWKEGDLGVTWFEIKVSPNAPGGKYRLQVGMYSRSDLKRVAAYDLGGKTVGDTIGLFPVKIKSDAQAAQVKQSTGYRLGGKIGLVGIGVGKDGRSSFDEMSFRPGDKIPLRLVWRAETSIKEDYTVFLQLLSPDGRVVAQADGQPSGGGFPTSFWDSGETLVDDREIALPAGLPSGQYTLITGMYLLSTGERLKVESGGDSVNLGTVIRIDGP